MLPLKLVKEVIVIHIMDESVFEEGHVLDTHGLCGGGGGLGVGPALALVDQHVCALALEDFAVVLAELASEALAGDEVRVEGGDGLVVELEPAALPVRDERVVVTGLDCARVHQHPP